MTAVTVSFDGERMHTFDTTDDGTTGVSNIGGGAGGGSEADFVYQGGSSYSRKVGTSSAGFEIDTTSFSPIRQADMTQADRKLVMFKILASNKGALSLLENQPASPSTMRLRIGDGSASYIEYDALGSLEYPIKGGWVIFPINVSVEEWRGQATGSPIVLSAVDYFGLESRFTATSRAENLMIDAIDIGIGLTLTGGTGSDTAGTFQSFVDDDEGELTNGRWGFFSTIEDIIYVFGSHWIGRDTAGATAQTIFTDSLRTLVFPDGLFDEGDAALNFDLANSPESSFELSQCTFVSTGNKWRYLTRWNNTPEGFVQISSADDEFQSYSGVLLDVFSGESFTYDKKGGTTTTGLTDGNTYKLRRNSLTAFKETRFNVIDTTNRLTALQSASTPVNLTAIAEVNDEVHELTKLNDTRAQFLVVGSAGSGTIDACIFQNFGKFTFTSAVAITSSTFVDCARMDLGGATLDGCTITRQNTPEGTALVTANDLSDISNCDFDNTPQEFLYTPTSTFYPFPWQGRGHAIQITVPGTYTFTGNTFTGYGPAHKSFNTAADVSASPSEITITAHGFSDYDPVYYNKEGGSDAIGLTDGNLYWVQVVDANTIKLFVNEGHVNPNATNKAPATLTPVTASPGETHTLYSANAAIYNSSGGLVTINVTDGDAPSIRNAHGSPLSTTVVNNNVLVTLTGLEENTEVRVFTQDVPPVEIDGIEDVISPTEFSFAAEAGVVVDIRIFHVEFEVADIEDFTIPATATTIPIQQRFDRNYRNP